MAYQANVFFFNDGIRIGGWPLLCQIVSVLMAYESTFTGAINLWPPVYIVSAVPRFAQNEIDSELSNIVTILRNILLQHMFDTWQCKAGNQIQSLLPSVAETQPRQDYTHVQGACLSKLQTMGPRFCAFVYLHAYVYIYIYAKLNICMITISWYLFLCIYIYIYMYR